MDEGRSVQDLAKTPDHSNCSTFYTLKVDIAGVNRTVGRGIVQAVLNLRLRLADEMRKQEQVSLYCFCPCFCPSMLSLSSLLDSPFNRSKASTPCCFDVLYILFFHPSLSGPCLLWETCTSLSILTWRRTASCTAWKGRRALAL